MQIPDTINSISCDQVLSVARSSETPKPPVQIFQGIEKRALLAVCELDLPQHNVTRTKAGRGGLRGKALN